MELQNNVRSRKCEDNGPNTQIRRALFDKILPCLSVVERSFNLPFSEVSTHPPYWKRKKKYISQVHRHVSMHRGVATGWAKRAIAWGPRAERGTLRTADYVGPQQ